MEDARRNRELERSRYDSYWPARRSEGYLPPAPVTRSRAMNFSYDRGTPLRSSSKRRSGTAAGPTS